MSKKDKYYLIREDIINEHIEYFDFQEMIFKDKLVDGVGLDTIDSMTTLFEDTNEFKDYIDKVNNEYNYTYKIIVKSNNEKKEKVLNVIWNDKVLSSISKLSDSKVDFTIDYNYYTFFEIIRNVKDPKTGLAKKIIKAKKESTRLSDNNKKIIESIYETKKEPLPKDLVIMFSDYLEFRALYLNYKDNPIGKENDFKEQLKKLKLQFKGD